MIVHLPPREADACADQRAPEHIRRANAYGPHFQRGLPGGAYPPALIVSPRCGPGARALSVAAKGRKPGFTLEVSNDVAPGGHGDTMACFVAFPNRSLAWNIQGTAA